MEFDRLDKLLSTASAALSDAPPNSDSLFGGAIRHLYALLSRRNGFYAFESALHVFPSGGPSLPGRSLEEWNEPRLWIDSYGELISPALFFAEDVFGGQFSIAGDTVLRFDPETAKSTEFASGIEAWGAQVLAQYNFATGYSIAHAWQVENGAIPVGHRLIPGIPFCVGGDFAVGNMVLVESAAAMRYWGNFAKEIAQLPDGAQLRFNPAVIEGLRCAGSLRGDSSGCRCLD
ncbi:SMI1/KNR4 family protein [Streptacidiphilus sp. 4-A2]|nr:SMI1/KNR4 family protein [Streptacidiphilus sp. 4-A2]